MPDTKMPPTPATDPSTLTLVVPAFNEGGRLAEGRNRLAGAISSGAIDPDRTDLIVVDDGSSDDTAKKARLLFGDLPHFELIELPSNSGKGAAIRAGISNARTPLVAFADADMAIDPEHIPQFVEMLADHDVAIGSRTMDESRAEGDTRTRRFERRAFNLLVKKVAGVNFEDTQCGFKAFRTPVARLLFHLTSAKRFAFDVELLNISDRLGLSVGEVPVAWKNVRGSRIRPLSDPVSMATDLFKVRFTRRPSETISAIIVRNSCHQVVSEFVTTDDLSGLDAVHTCPIISWGDHGTAIIFALCPGYVVERAFGLLVARHDVERIDVGVADLERKRPLKLLNSSIPIERS